MNSECACKQQQQRDEDSRSFSSCLKLPWHEPHPKLSHEGRHPSRGDLAALRTFNGVVAPRFARAYAEAAHQLGASTHLRCTSSGCHTHPSSPCTEEIQHKICASWPDGAMPRAKGSTRSPAPRRQANMRLQRRPKAPTPQATFTDAAPSGNSRSSTHLKLRRPRSPSRPCCPCRT